MPNFVANTAAEVFHEVIAAGVVDASGDATRGKEIEPVAGNADAGHEVEAKSLAQLRLEERVNVGEDGAVVFVTIVVALVIPPGSFDVEAKAAFPEADEVTADAGIDAILFSQRVEVHGVVGADSRLRGCCRRSGCQLAAGQRRSWQTKERHRRM